MNTFALLLILIVGSYSNASSILYQCSIYGDPQVIPFPVNGTGGVGSQFCDFTGYAVLFRSPYVLISVRGSGRFNSDVVTDFNIILFDDHHVPICVIHAGDFNGRTRSCSEGVVVDISSSHQINVHYRKASFSAWVQFMGSHYKLTLFTSLAHTSGHGVSGLCIHGCSATRSAPSSIDITSNTTDEQIVTSALAASVCETFIQEVTNGFAQTTPGMIDAVRQACISDVKITGDKQFAREGIETIIANMLTQEKPIDVADIGQLVTNTTSMASQASHTAEVQVEKLVAAATWPCQPTVPICVMPSFVRRQHRALLGK